MGRREAQIQQEAADAWHAEGFLSAEAHARITERLAVGLERTSLAMQTFYALGGILLGGATAALYALLQINDLLPETESTAWAYFVAWAAVFAVSSVAVHQALRDHDLGDALVLGTLLLAAILLGPEPPVEALLWMSPLLAAGVLAWRRDAIVPSVAALGILAFGIPAILFRTIDEEPAAGVWFTVATAAFAAATFWRPSWRHALLAVVSAWAIAAWASVVFVLIDPSWTGGHEVMLATGIAAVLAAGLALKEKVPVFVAGLALTADIVVFAFDVGDVTAGLATLLVLGIGLIVAATRLRRRT